MTKRLTLVVPGLDAVAGVVPRSGSGAGWRCLLARGTVRRGDPDLETMLWRLAGGAMPAPAVAPVTRLADTGRCDTHWWLRADPVCLVAGQSALTLAGTVTLPADQTRDLAAALRDHLADAGYGLESPNGSRWYLRCPDAVLAQTVAPANGAMDVGSRLPSGDGGPRLRALMTEIQMLLHDHPVNRARESAGLWPVNALWLWGAGRLPAQATGSFDQTPALRTADPYALGLWTLAGRPGAPLPSNARQGGWTDPDNESHQVLMLEAATAADSAPGHGLDGLDRDWLSPLIDALRRGRLGALHVADAGTTVVLDGAAVRGLRARLRDLAGLRPADWPW